MTRIILALRLLVPAVWMGLVVGLSFIETPLKFTAPGITTALGLGIGRIVFTALAIAGAVLLVVLTVLAFARPRETRGGFVLIGALWVVVAVQSLVIRPLLSARSDVVIAGGDPGASWLHYGYIVAELMLLALLLGYIVHIVRGVHLERRVA